MSKSTYLVPIRLCFIMWLLFYLEMTFQYDLGFLGIYPRSVYGLIGIVTAPMVHGSLNHLISNTIPLLVLSGSLFFFFPSIASRVFFQAYFFTNLLVWLFARPYHHIGASGLVYALASFLIFYGFFKRNFISVVVSLVMLFFYGGLVYGVLPTNSYVSWESHLMGALVGFTTAYLITKK